MSIPFTYTNDSITVIHLGKPHVVPKGSQIGRAHV